MSSRKKEEKLCPEQLTEQAEAVGRQIQQDRQEAGFSREEIEHLTKISPFFLESLEAGSFLILPGEVFCKGFIRNIYRVLKKDPQVVIGEIEAVFVLIRQMQVPTERKRSYSHERSLGPVRKSDRSRVRYWSLAALLVLIGTTLIWRVRHVRPAIEPTALSTTSEPVTAVQPAPSPVVAGTPASAGASTPTSTLLPPAVVPTVDLAAAIPTPIVPLQPSQPATAVEAATPAVPPVPSASQLTMMVRAPVGIRQKIDGKDSLSKEYAQGEYQFAFQDKAEFVVQDAAEVSFTFDSKTIETLGKKKEMKKITFVNSKQERTRIE